MYSEKLSKQHGKAVSSSKVSELTHPTIAGRTPFLHTFRIIKSLAAVFGGGCELTVTTTMSCLTNSTTTLASKLPMSSTARNPMLSAGPKPASCWRRHCLAAGATSAIAGVAAISAALQGLHCSGPWCDQAESSSLLSPAVPTKWTLRWSSRLPGGLRARTCSAPPAGTARRGGVLGARALHPPHDQTYLPLFSEGQ